MSEVGCRPARRFFQTATEMLCVALRASGSTALVLGLAAAAGGCGNSSQKANSAAGRSQPENQPATPAMIAIPGGSFDFGKNPQAGQPGQPTTVAPFSIDKTEVTVASYAECVAAGRCSEPHGDWQECNWAQRQQRAHDPVNCVDWNQAESYCTWRGQRLPSEQEWEFAARGPDGRTYPWGEAAPGSQLCWEDNPARAENASGTCQVGAYAEGASPFGVLDMSGNVWEWTTGSETMPGGGALRVLRGGGWSYDRLGPPEVGVLERQSQEPGHYATDLGFRCAAPN
jgi:formylglycine-generating enzyme required for sulfatase activity